MWAALKAFWNKLSALGVEAGMDSREIRMVTLTNRFCVVGAFALLIGSLHTFIIEDHFLGTAILGFMLLFMGGLLLNYFKFYRAAMMYLLLIINSALFYFDAYCGPEAGVYFYYFPFMLAIALLLDFSQPVWLLIFISVTVFFLVLAIATNHSLFLNESLRHEQIRRMWSFNLLNSVLVVFYCTYLIIGMNHQQYLGFMQRIEERREAESKIRAALSEKETLLAEVHHRVKNNLSVISSLLSLQSNLVNNEYTRGVLIESKNRVSSMALIHQKLYGTSSFSEIHFSKYISELVDEIKLSYIDTLSSDIRVELQSDKASLNLTSAIPCGLILNELLSNCYKHAFRRRSEGLIRISFREKQGEYELQVEDNGHGLPGGFDPESSASLGMTIISSLAGQIDASYEFKNRESGGTSFRMRFRENAVAGSTK